MRPDHAVDAALGQLSSKVRSRARTDIKGALEDDLGFVVAELPVDGPQREGHGSCDGMSFLRDRKVMFRPTRSKRENFTLAHELGHVLVDRCDEIQDWLGDMDERGAARTEEWLCDQIAQQLLLPDDLVAKFSVPVSAAGVVELSSQSQASLAACAVAVGHRLVGPAGIVLINADTGVVDLASIQPDINLGWPANFPWKGQSLPEGHPLQRLRRDPSGTVCQRLTWRSPWGTESTYYVDACRHRSQIVAIFTDQDIWGSELFHLDRPRDFLKPRRGTVTCCGKTREVSTFPCATCKGNYCPVCKQCRCDKREVTEVLCTSCFQRKQGHLVSDGVCVDCQ